MLTVEAWWQQFSVQTLGGAAGTLLVSALLSTLSKTVRQKFWTPIGRGLRWLTTIRLTTTGKIAAQRAVAASEIQAAKDEAAAEKAEAARVRGVAADAANSFRREIDELVARNKELGLERVSTQSKLVVYAREQGRAEGRAEAEAEIAAQRSALQVKPVWRITSLESEGEYWLENVQPGVEGLSDVSIEPVLSTFVFHSGPQWPGPWQGSAWFKGQLIGAGVKLGAAMRVRYRDQNGDWNTGQAQLEPPRKARPQAIVF